MENKEDKVSRLIHIAINRDKRPDPEAKQRLIQRLLTKQAELKPVADFPDAAITVLSVLLLSATLWLACNASTALIPANLTKLWVGLQCAGILSAAIVTTIRRRQCQKN